MATTLDKELKRRIAIDGVDYTVVLDPEGLRVTGKGRRTPEVALKWRELVSGEAAMAVALNASLDRRPPAGKAPTATPPEPPAPAAAERPAKRGRPARATGRR